MSIRFVDLSNFAGPENAASDISKVPGVINRLRRGTLLLSCPDSCAAQPVANCFRCQWLEAIGKVQVSGEVALFEQVWRIICSHPTLRKIMLSNISKDDVYCKKLKQAIARLPLDDDTKRKVVGLFVIGSIAINCPVSRAKTGTWRVENPPCPACQYFHGVRQIEDSVFCLCTHSKSKTLSRTVVGTFDLVES